MQFNKKIITERLPNLLPLVIDYVKASNGRAYLAGGSLRGLFTKTPDEVCDYDLFFASQTAASEAVVFFEEYCDTIFVCPLGHLVSFKTKDTGVKIQIIKEQTYINSEILISSFDINACCIAYDGKKVTTTRAAIRDCRRKRITINVANFPMATFRRIIKYVQKGYSLPQSTVIGFLTDIHEAGMANLTINGRFYID
jgi:hypothetical protein